MNTNPRLFAAIDALEQKLNDDATDEEQTRNALQRQAISEAGAWLVEVVTAVQRDMVERFGITDDQYSVELCDFCDHQQNWWGGAAGAAEEFAAGRTPTAFDLACDIGSSVSDIRYTIGPVFKMDTPFGPTCWQIETFTLGGYDIPDAKTLLELLREEVH